MNYNYAIDILDLNYDFTKEELRKAYLKKTLKYHPDKNLKNNSCDMFHKVKESYEFLLNDTNSNTNINNYGDILKSFLRSLKINDNMDIFNKIFSIFETTQEDAIKIFSSFDKDDMNQLYKIISNYKDVFNISTEFLSKLREQLNETYEDKPIITINSTIEDAINANIYVYKDKKNKYYVPLWHEELYFKNHIIRVNIECDDVVIENNNIIVEKYLNIDDIINNEKLEIYIGNQMFIINRSQIRFVEFQKIILYSSGMPLINHKNIYCIKKKGNIIVMLHLKLKN
tara:strand:+ start:2357 stop:3211 length:855 start_codon:yes stop_codon:yes gene_type:complete